MFFEITLVCVLLIIIIVVIFAVRKYRFIKNKDDTKNLVPVTFLSPDVVIRFPVNDSKNRNKGRPDNSKKVRNILIGLVVCIWLLSVLFLQNVFVKAFNYLYFKYLLFVTHAN
jgi:hypothetical protein